MTEIKLFARNLLILLWFLAIPAISEPANTLYIVDGVAKVEKRNDLPSNAEPWRLEIKNPTLNKSDDLAVTVTHGCDFYDIEYFIHPIDNKDTTDKRVAVRVQPGEFCDLQNVVFAHPTIIAVKIWDNIAYLQEFAPLVFDERENAYIPGIDLPDPWNMSHLLTPYPHNRKSSFCTNIEFITPATLKKMQASKYITKFNNDLCHTFVLPLTKIRKKIGLRIK